MKKNILGLILVLCLGLCLNTVSFADSTKPITSPEMKSYNKSPSYNDTYFTYYADITGYKSNGLWGFYSKNNRSVNIPPMYDDIEALDSKYIKVKRGGRWGIVSTDGYQLINTVSEKDLKKSNLFISFNSIEVDDEFKGLYKKYRLVFLKQSYMIY